MANYLYSSQLDGHGLSGRIASLGLPSSITYPTVMAVPPTVTSGASPTLVSSDGTHPSADGHRELAYVQANLLRDYLGGLNEETA